MEQARRKCAHIERILLIAGMPNAGKSTLLRHMFTDVRLGTKGIIPNTRKISLIQLSRERSLWVRFTSPHENSESEKKFLKKINRAAERGWSLGWRINIACPIQPTATNKTPNPVDLCRALKQEFLPERIRLIQISPRQDGENGNMLSLQEVDALRNLEVEILTVDARRHVGKNAYPNGLLLADFFDFT